MTIKRAKRKTNFTMMSNTGLQDKNISFKAKGLLAYMLSLPDDWVFYQSELREHATDGETSVRSGLKELEQNGYLIKERKRDEDGKLRESNWVVHDEPLENPKLENQVLDNQVLDNHALQSTNSTKDLNKESTNKERSSAELTEDFESLWKLYPNKKGKKKAKASYKRAIKNGATNKEIQDGIIGYKNHLKRNDWLKPAHGSTWFNNERWEDDYGTEGSDKADNLTDNLWEE